MLFQLVLRRPHVDFSFFQRQMKVNSIAKKGKPSPIGSLQGGNEQAGQGGQRSNYQLISKLPHVDLFTPSLKVEAGPCLY
jgi:hypothetical protein